MARIHTLVGLAAEHKFIGEVAGGSGVKLGCGGDVVLQVGWVELVDGWMGNSVQGGGRGCIIQGCLCYVKLLILPAVT
jgi:hypothetical protein